MFPFQLILVLRLRFYVSGLYVYVFVCVFSIDLYHNGTLLPKHVYVFSYVNLAFCWLGELLLPPIYGRNLPLNACQRALINVGVTSPAYNIQPHNIFIILAIDTITLSTPFM